MDSTNSSHANYPITLSEVEFLPQISLLSTASSSVTVPTLHRVNTLICIHSRKVESIPMYFSNPPTSCQELADNSLPHKIQSNSYKITTENMVVIVLL